MDNGRTSKEKGEDDHGWVPNQFVTCGVLGCGMELSCMPSPLPGDCMERFEKLLVV